MNPIKIRSKTFLLIYKKLINKELILDFLKKQLKIENDDDWGYIVKQELLLNSCGFTVVYIDIRFKPYMTISKISFYIDNEMVEPKVYVWNSDFLLRSILTFCGKFDSCEILTNYDEKMILENVIELKCCKFYDSVEKTDTEKVDENIDTTYDKITDLMTERQIVRFMNHYESLVKMSKDVARKENLGKMSLKLNNMLNFKNNYRLTEEQLLLIDESRNIIKRMKSELNRNDDA